MAPFTVRVDTWPRYLVIALGAISVRFSFYARDDIDQFKREIAAVSVEDLERLKRDIENLA